MRKFLVVTLVLVLVLGLSGLALAFDNVANVDQSGTANDLLVDQGIPDNYAVLTQIALTTNEAWIRQWGGNNWLVAATRCKAGGIDKFNRAYQESRNANNVLDLVSKGNANEVGLFQRGRDRNYAKIRQSLGGNHLRVYQDNNGGYNYLDSTQTNFDFATVCQIAINGRNNIKIIQK